MIGSLAGDIRRSVLSLAVRKAAPGFHELRARDARLRVRGVDVRGVVDSWGLSDEVRAELTPGVSPGDHRSLCAGGPMIVRRHAGSRQTTRDRRAVILDGPPIDGDERSTCPGGRDAR